MKNNYRIEMTDDRACQKNDVWSDWLLHRRHGGDPDLASTIQLQTANYADRVLQGARISPGMTLLDVGTGDGLVAFEAIRRIGPSLKVILTDISAPMLMHVEKLVSQVGVMNQCVFLECFAENLEGVDLESVDAVVTRAVLAYVSDKAAALREFFRVLKPGGCLSICEPLMRDQALALYALKTLMDAQSSESRDRLSDLQWRIRAAQFPHTIEEISQDPTTNFMELDLVHLAQDAGFTEVHMESHVDKGLTGIASWEAFLESSPHPLAPPIKQIVAEQFTTEERQYFTERFRPIIEAGESVGCNRNVYLTARKPSLSP